MPGEPKGPEKPFYPHKAKRAGGPHGVENVPFDEIQTQAEIINSINNLGELFKGADPSDYDTAFERNSTAILERFYNITTQLQMNLKRIIERRKQIKE